MFSSCEFIQLYQEHHNLDYISQQVKADKCKITFVEEENTTANDTNSKKYIELNILNSQYLKDSTEDKNLITSYCALTALERFDNDIWKEIDGVHIVFDGKDNWPNKKLYYYELNELNKINKIINMSNAFLAALEKVDTRVNNFDLVFVKNEIDTIISNDSISIASFFANELFEENPDLVIACYRVFNEFNGIKNSTKKYYYHKVNLKDTVNNVKTSIAYNIYLNIMLPDNNTHLIKYLVKAENLEKFVAIEM